MSLMVGFDLLDRQIEDRDGLPIGKVDDVEFARAEDGTLYVAALLTGQEALGVRLGGTLGRWVAGVAGRLDIHQRGPRRIAYDLVDRVDSAVILSVRRDLLPEPALEAWLNEHLIGRIPGADHAG